MAGETYILNSTALKFNGEAGADVAFSVEGLTNTAGRVSAQKDFGASARPYKYKWYCELQCQATPTQYQTLDLYIAEAPDNDSTQISGDIGSSDAALGDVDMLENLIYIGSVVAENAAASEIFAASGEFESKSRYLSVVAYNDTGASINATDSNFIFYLIPYYEQAQ